MAPVIAIRGVVLDAAEVMMTTLRPAVTVEAADALIAEYDNGMMNRTRALAKPLAWLLIIALAGTVGAGLLQGLP